MYIAVGLGAALVAGGLIRALRGRAGGAAYSRFAGLVTALTPLILRSLARPARFLWEEAWSAVGREDIAADHDRLGRIERVRHLVVVVRGRGRDRDPGRDRRGNRRRQAR